MPPSVWRYNGTPMETLHLNIVAGRGKYSHGMGKVYSYGTGQYRRQPRDGTVRLDIVMGQHWTRSWRDNTWHLGSTGQPSTGQFHEV